MNKKNFLKLIKKKLIKIKLTKKNKLKTLFY